MSIREQLSEPYGASDTVPCFDFNREIFRPGAHPDFPDGALGVRVDDDFWLVAVLPYSFINWTIEQIVADLWPDVADRAEYNPDTEVSPQ